MNDKDSITKNAIDAGYSPKTAYAIGSENLKKPEIKKYIEEIMNDAASKLEITLEWKMRYLKRCVERCMPDDEERRIKPTGMINAIAELNKMQGHYSAQKIALGEDKGIEEELERIREAAANVRKDF